MEPHGGRRRWPVGCMALFTVWLVFISTEAQAAVTRPKAALKGQLQPANHNDGPTEGTASLVEASDQMEFPVLPNSPCADCHRLMTAVSTSALQLNLNREDVILQTQTIAQQLGVCASIGVQCNVYEEVRTWLVRGGISGGSGPHMAAVKDNPYKFCQAVNACGGVDLAALLASVGGPLRDPQDAVIVRLRLKDNLSRLSHAGPRWRLFVKQFLGDVAGYLKVNSTRLAIKQADGDYLAELIIQSAEHVDENGTVTTSGPAPELLGRKLKSALSVRSNVLGVPARLLDAVDRSYQLQLVPLVVPATVDKHPPLRPNPPKPVVDCNLLKDQSGAACGNGFKCSKECHDRFLEFHGKCLANTLNAQQHKRVYDEFKRFFFLCEHCTEARVKMVKDKCGIKSTKSDLPPKCSMACSAVYVPYFHECLVSESGTFPPKTRQAVEDFYGACRRCTPARQQAVRKICDPRKGTQEYYYPGGCSTKCSAAFNPFYDACLDGPLEVTGAPKGSLEFRHICQTAAEGGANFRLTLLQDITSIVHQQLWRKEVQKALAEVLEIPSERLVFTGIFSAGGDKVEQPSGMTPRFARTAPRMFVDFRVTVGSHSDEAPDTVVARLRLYVSDPMNSIFHKSVFSNLDSSAGVVRLVPNTHAPSANKGPTSLVLAQQELQKAKEQQLGADIVRLLASIVAYHTAVQKQAPASATAALLADVGLQAAVAHNKPQSQIDYFRAEHAYREAVAKQGAPAQVLALKAHRDYTAAIARDEPALSVGRAKAVWEWRQAQAMGANSTALDLLRAIVKLAEDRQAKLHPDILQMDAARVQYLKSVHDGANQTKLNFDGAVLQYMTRKARHASIDSLDAAEALVAYRKAQLDGASKLVIEEKRAVVDYMQAKEQKQPEDQLKKLAEVVLGLRRKVEAEQDAQKPKL